MIQDELVAAGVLASLALCAEEADEVQAWPTLSWNAIRDGGVLTWSIPTGFGGAELPHRDQLDGSEQIASACLTTAFILSQREAAIRHLLRGPEHLKAAFLPVLAKGDAFITIGLSQLTTSRQHQAPALRATQRGNDFRLDGEIPWVTGAQQADAIVIGATLEDGQQALLLLPRNAQGVSIAEPLRLAGLAGSLTTGVRCRDVILSERDLLAGPKEKVLSAGGGGLETSCLALGLTRAAVGFLREESKHRKELVEITAKFSSKLDEARSRMHSLATTSTSDEVLAFRAQCTLLALRSTQAALLFAKGNGFLRNHPAQRWARQALFFLVWSCPRSVSEEVLEGLLPSGE